MHKTKSLYQQLSHLRNLWDTVPQPLFIHDKWQACNSKFSSTTVSAANVKCLENASTSVGKSHNLILFSPWLNYYKGMVSAVVIIWTQIAGMLVLPSFSFPGTPFLVFKRRRVGFFKRGKSFSRYSHPSRTDFLPRPKRRNSHKPLKKHNNKSLMPGKESNVVRIKTLIQEVRNMNCISFSTSAVQWRRVSESSSHI